MSDLPKSDDKLEEEAEEDARIEEIWEDAENVALHCGHIASVVNPYPAGSDDNEIWAHAFRSAYADLHER